MSDLQRARMHTNYALDAVRLGHAEEARSHARLAAGLCASTEARYPQSNVPILVEYDHDGSGTLRACYPGGRVVEVDVVQAMAAPDLLAALKQCRDALPCYCGSVCDCAVAVASAAIAKSTE